MNIHSFPKKALDKEAWAHHSSRELQNSSLPEQGLPFRLHNSGLVELLHFPSSPRGEVRLTQGHYRRARLNAALFDDLPQMVDQATQTLGGPLRTTLLEGGHFRFRMDVLPWMDIFELPRFVKSSGVPCGPLHLANPFDLKQFSLDVAIDDAALSLQLTSRDLLLLEMNGWLGASTLWLGWAAGRFHSLPLLSDLRSGLIRLKVRIHGHLPLYQKEGHETVDRVIPLSWRDDLE